MKSSSKHCIIQHIICFAMAIFICSSFILLRADAYSENYSYKIITLKQSTSVTAKGYSYTYNEETDTYLNVYYLYKISVPANGFAKFQTTGTDNSLYLYKTFKKSKDLDDSESMIDLYNHKTYYRVLPKGTYYIYATKGTKFKWSFSKSENPTNYCRAKAAKLAAGKKKTIVFNYRYEFDRWYKLVLPKKKTITITLKALDEYSPDFKVYNSKGYFVRCPELTNTSYRTAILPKGTYFIRIMRDSYDENEYEYYSGRVSQITWK